jgi:hypothetical protein
MVLIGDKKSCTASLHCVCRSDQNLQYRSLGYPVIGLPSNLDRGILASLFPHPPHKLNLCIVLDMAY